MGNCLKINSSDNISLLRGGSSDSNNSQDYVGEQRNDPFIYSVIEYNMAHVDISNYLIF